jgi:glycosyltransferase involved in cell wall biosynthesis
MLGQKPKILYLYDKNGICWWRLHQPAMALQRNGYADVRMIELKFATKQELSEAAHWCDIIHTVGLVGTDGLAFIRNYQKLGCKVVFDYDDLHFNVSPFNPAYRQFGLEDVEVRNPKTGDTQFLWKDGENGFDIKRNKIRFHAYKACLQEADAITTTTLYLKNAMDEVSEGKSNLRVLPNCIDFTQWKPLDIRDKFPQKFRFGWAVSGSHGEDWIFARGFLHKFLKDHPDATFVCVGDTYMDIREGLKDVKDQIEWYPMSDLWEGHYSLRIAMLALDCAIMPLADIEFNRCKSPLKYEEMTAFGYPVIAQNMEPYSSHIENNKTGLLASTTDEWVTALERMYSDASLRSRLRFNATMNIKEVFDLEKVCIEWYYTYKDLLGERVIS